MLVVWSSRIFWFKISLHDFLAFIDLKAILFGSMALANIGSHVKEDVKDIIFILNSNLIEELVV